MITTILSTPDHGTLQPVAITGGFIEYAQPIGPHPMRIKLKYDAEIFDQLRRHIERPALREMARIIRAEAARWKECELEWVVQGNTIVLHLNSADDLACLANVLTRRGFDHVPDFSEACESYGYEIHEDYNGVWHDADALIYCELIGESVDIDEVVELLDGTFLPHDHASALDYGDGYIPSNELPQSFDWWKWLDRNDVGVSCCGETYALDEYVVCTNCDCVVSEYDVIHDGHNGYSYCAGCYAALCSGDRSRVQPYHTFNSQCETLGTYEGFPPVYALWHIGFEVEKTSIDGAEYEGDEIPETTLFCGVETDGSCGVEAISHIIPLHDDCLDNLINLANEASEILDAPTSNKCGGHINLSRAGGVDINHLRPYLAPFYALYKRRLGNRYCAGNKAIDDKAPREKYSVLNVKGGGVVEFRLPSAVTSTNAFIFRYRAMLAMVTAYEVDMDAAEFIDSLTPLVSEVYGADKLEQWQYDSLAFLDYLTTGTIDASIRQYI